jgi:hypothetical protein
MSAEALQPQLAFLRCSTPPPLLLLLPHAPTKTLCCNPSLARPDLACPALPFLILQGDQPRHHYPCPAPVQPL